MTTPSIALGHRAVSAFPAAISSHHKTKTGGSRKEPPVICVADNRVTD